MFITKVPNSAKGSPIVIPLSKRVLSLDTCWAVHRFPEIYLEKNLISVNAVTPENIHTRDSDLANMDIFGIILEGFVLWMIQMKSVEY